MNPPKDRAERRERERREAEREHGHRGRDDERPPEQRGTGYGRELPAYLHFLARRWEGSVVPTPQAYARALQQWRQLPGAVTTAPADVPRPQKSISQGKAKSSLESLHKTEKEG